MGDFEPTAEFPSTSSSNNTSANTSSADCSETKVQQQKVEEEEVHFVQRTFKGLEIKWGETPDRYKIVFAMALAFVVCNIQSAFFYGYLLAQLPGWCVWFDNVNPSDIVQISDGEG